MVLPLQHEAECDIRTIERSMQQPCMGGASKLLLNKKILQTQLWTVLLVMLYSQSPAVSASYLEILPLNVASLSPTVS
eukprot:220493-Amphidinium_carterae.1